MDIFKTKGKTDAGQDPNFFDAPEQTPQDQADHLASIIANAWDKTGLIEIIEVKAAVGQVHLIGRVKPENEKKMVNSIIDNVLRRCEGSNCNAWIGKRYLRKNGKTVYGWEISFVSNDMKEAAQLVCDAIDEVVPRQEVMEAPLLGPRCPTSDGVKKGARPVGVS